MPFERQTSECTSIQQVREHIDRIDRQMVRLIAERGAYVQQAARFKASEEEVKAPQRAEQVVSKAVSLSRALGADPAVVESVYRAMIAAFIDAEMARFRSACPPSHQE